VLTGKVGCGFVNETEWYKTMTARDRLNTPANTTNLFKKVRQQIFGYRAISMNA